MWKLPEQPFLFSLDGNQSQLAILINNFTHSRALHAPIDRMARVSFTPFDSLSPGWRMSLTEAVGHLYLYWCKLNSVISEGPGQRLLGHVHCFTFMSSTSLWAIHRHDERGHLSFLVPIMKPEARWQHPQKSTSLVFSCTRGEAFLDSNVENQSTKKLHNIVNDRSLWILQECNKKS